jgi:hypothetical protein
MGQQRQFLSCSTPEEVLIGADVFAIREFEVSAFPGCNLQHGVAGCNSRYADHAQENKSIRKKTVAYVKHDKAGMIVAYEVSPQDTHRPLSFGLPEGARQILKTSFLGTVPQYLPCADPCRLEIQGIQNR